MSGVSLPVVAFAAYGTKQYLNQTAFAFDNQLTNKGSFLFKTQGEKTADIALAILRGTVKGALSGLALSFIPSVLRLKSDEAKNCILDSVTLCACLGAVETACFVNSVIGLQKPFKDAFEGLGSLDSLMGNILNFQNPFGGIRN